MRLSNANNERNSNRKRNITKRTIEYTKEVIKSRKLKDRQYNGQTKKGQKAKMIYITRTPLKAGLTSGTPEE
jgi:hypothetical protein